MPLVTARQPRHRDRPDQPGRAPRAALSAREIINRVNEISFNTALIKELRAIALMQQMIDGKGVDLGAAGQTYPPPDPHRCRGAGSGGLEQAERRMGVSANAVRARARLGRAWLDAHFDKIGRASSFDLEAFFDDPAGRRRPGALGDDRHPRHRRGAGRADVSGLSRAQPAAADPALAMLAVLAAEGGPLLASYTQVFMEATGGFIIQYFPLFLLGAVFGKLMEASGSARVLADGIIRGLGPRRAILAVILSCAVMTYGGVSLFVVAFAVWPIASALFREANCPRC
jgi:hypothetical protein